MRSLVLSLSKQRDWPLGAAHFGPPEFQVIGRLAPAGSRPACACATGAGERGEGAGLSMSKPACANLAQAISFGEVFDGDHRRHGKE